MINIVGLILYKRTFLLTYPSNTHLSSNMAHMRRPRSNKTSANKNSMCSGFVSPPLPPLSFTTLLEKIVQILITCDDELIVPHLALTILSILIGISAEGPLIVLTISEIYKKVTNNESSYLHIKLGIESIYEILSYYSKDFDVIEDIQKLNFLWEDNFIG